MSFPVLGMIISSVVIVFLYSLFAFEKNRGLRLGYTVRTKLDSLVLYGEKVVAILLHHVGRDTLRQSIHFSFHTFLTFFLGLLDACRLKVRVLLRSNRTLARKSRSDIVHRNMFHEIADYKASVALSEEEKIRHKEKSLRG